MLPRTIFSSGARAALASALVLCAGLAAALMPAGDATAKELQPDEITKQLLRDPEFVDMAISKDGAHLAIARRTAEQKVMVTVYKRADMAPVISFDPGSQGEITNLVFLGNDRLLVGATRINPAYGMADFEPILVIATLDGADPFVLPGDFYSTIEGDPNHILVYGCGFAKGNGGCTLPQIRKDDIKKLTRKGELVIEGPKDSLLVLNRTADRGFALAGDEDDDTTRAYVYKPDSRTWEMINDSAKTGLHVIPLAVSRDGMTGYLQSERKEGMDVIERYDFATGKRTEIYAHPTSDPTHFVRSLDDREVIGARYEATNPTYKLWLTDHPDAKLLSELHGAFPGKEVTVFDATADRNFLILIVGSDREPGTYYLLDRAAKKATILARSYPWLVPEKQGSQKPFTMKARDGLTLHGLLTLPPGSSGKNLPMVVLPHGGPHGVLDAWGYDPELQILAQHGYAVLQVNYRGSGGYGWQFEAKGYRQWGRAMQDDVTDATKWAIAEGVADPKRICIYGASYGGYAAMMGPIREPGLYQCAAGLAGVFDLGKMYKWGSIRRSDHGQRYLKRVLGEDQAELAANSPAKQVDKLTVPVLLAHGYRDARVDVKHAQLMARELGKRKRPVEYQEYSNTGHHLVLPKHRLDFYTRLLRFLDANIGSGATATTATTASTPATAAAPATASSATTASAATP